MAATASVAAEQTDTSETISEVDLNSQERTAFGRTYQQVIDDVIQVGGRYKVIHSKLTNIFGGILGGEVEELKLKVWQVRMGVAGVKVNVNGQVMDWTEFVKFAFDITPRRLNQLLDIEDGVTLTKPETKENKKSWVKDAQAMEVNNKKEPEPEVTHKAKRWYKVGDDSRSQGIGSKNDLRAQGKRRHDEPPPPHKIGERAEQCNDKTDKKQEIPQPATLDKGDPYFHFHQFRGEPQTMASELAAMFLEFHMDEQQTTIVLDLLKKQLKAQRKALAAATVTASESL